MKQKQNDILEVKKKVYLPNNNNNLCRMPFSKKLNILSVTILKLFLMQIKL